MIKIDYPEYQPNIKNQQGKEYIFDEIRKQWIWLTPEEWVRQNFLQYLTRCKKYPSSLIAVEKEIQLGELTKRFDIVVYDRNTNPWMIIECKEMNVSLTRPVLNQALRYNIILNVPYIIITNGSHCYGFSGNKGLLEELSDLPDFNC
ncbi:MAG: type I restriction enzyme HsdR N-terminal domain-containing protein [Ferruginibacter sp.]|nr:type I restriction enzyme HsdR N-terminal domain-containing protein [Ferruginibacter sp.]